MNKFDFNDILIKPAKQSNIQSRKDINPFHNGFLPLITAPMDSVIDIPSELKYRNLKILTTLPRGETGAIGFESYSLIEIEKLFKNKELSSNGHYLIDIANGHMTSLLSLTKELKLAYPKIILMVGNVANPETYYLLSNAGADYVRVGIGNGGACSTTLHTGIGFPMGSLICECYELSATLKNPAKIVADGGMQNYSDIIKALALGADYVMVGNLFNKAIDSCGDNYLWKFFKVSNKIANLAYKYKIPIYKKFRGMSTKEVQRKWGNTTIKTSEGVIRFRKAEYYLQQWVENFEDYLRSAMSYSNCKTLEEFIGNVEIIKISENSYQRFKK